MTISRPADPSGGVNVESDARRIERKTGLGAATIGAVRVTIPPEGPDDGIDEGGTDYGSVLAEWQGNAAGRSDLDLPGGPSPGPTHVAPHDPPPGAAPRLAHSRIRLADGRDVGVAVAGHGIPLVVVHGLAADGLLYSQTLSRLAGMGFKIIALDSPGHGGTDPLGPLAPLEAYVVDLERVMEALGVRQAVLVGHSMGGRLVAELAVAMPHLPIGVVLIDAIMGDTWDRMNLLFRVAPLGYGALAAALVADTVLTLPVLSDPRQALKLAHLVIPTGAHVVRRPWRLVGPLVSIVRATPSSETLEQLRERGVPVAVVHGEHDLAVPLRSGESAAARAGGDLVVVHGARHSWMLRDPETFPAILAELLEGRLGEGVERARSALGLTASAAPEEVERAFYAPGAAVLDLTPPDPVGVPASAARPPTRPPRFHWTRSAPEPVTPGSHRASC